MISPVVGTVTLLREEVVLKEQAWTGMQGLLVEFVVWLLKDGRGAGGKEEGLGGARRATDITGARRPKGIFRAARHQFRWRLFASFGCKPHSTPFSVGKSTTLVTLA